MLDGPWVPVTLKHSWKRQQLRASPHHAGAGPVQELCEGRRAVAVSGGGRQCLPGGAAFRQPTSVFLHRCSGLRSGRRDPNARARRCQLRGGANASMSALEREGGTNSSHRVPHWPTSRPSPCSVPRSLHRARRLRLSNPPRRRAHGGFSMRIERLQSDRGTFQPPPEPRERRSQLLQPLALLSFALLVTLALTTLAQAPPGAAGGREAGGQVPPPPWAACGGG